MYVNYPGMEEVVESKFSPILQHVIASLGGIEQIKRNLSAPITKAIINTKKENNNKCSYK